MKYGLRPEVRIEESDQGGLLVLERPLRMVRLNASLLTLVRRMKNEPLCATTDAQKRALDALVKSGFALSFTEQADSKGAQPSVSVVIPVKDRAEELRSCLESLCALDYPRHLLEVVVVDDGSSDPTPAVVREFAARLPLRLIESGAVGGGPALARNRGAYQSQGEVLALIDSDCTASAAWLKELVPSFADPQLAAVGGWVDGMNSDLSLDRYETVMSSLNLGKRGRSGDVGEDTFYLPSCNLLIRAEAFRGASGFRAELHVGEDVDLTWRLRDAGYRIAYLPCGAVRHNHRSRLGAFLKRRFEYGTSEGLLQMLHPIRRKKMALPPLPGALLLCLILALTVQSALPLIPAVGFFTLDTVQSVLRLRKSQLPHSWGQVCAARLRATGSLAYYLGYHLLRYYFLPLLAVTALIPAFIPLTLAIALGVGLVDYRVRAPQLEAHRFLFYYLLEQLWYGAGVFWGCVRVGRFASYRMKLKTA